MRRYLRDAVPCFKYFDCDNTRHQKEPHERTAKALEAVKEIIVSKEITSHSLGHRKENTRVTFDLSTKRLFVGSLNTTIGVQHRCFQPMC